MKPFRLAAGAILAILIIITASYLQAIYVFWLALLALLSLQWPAAGISVLFLTISADFQARLAGGIFVSYSELQFAVCVTASALGLHHLRGLDWRPLKWGLPFLGTVLISSLIQLPFYKVPFHLLRISEIFVAATLALNVLGGKGTFPGRTNQLFKWSIAGATVFYSATGLLQFALAREARIFSFFSNPNQFGGYLILLLPFSLAFFSITPGRERWLWGYLSSLTILSLSLTLSRSALLAGLISSTLILFIYLREGEWRRSLHRMGCFLKAYPLVVCLHIAAAAGVVVWLASSPSTQMLIANLKERSMGSMLDSLKNSRWPYFRIGLEIWRDHLWIGVGPGRYAEILPEYQNIVECFRERIIGFDRFEHWLPVHVHSLYLQLGVNFGISGLLAFLYFAGSGMRTLAHRLYASSWALAGTAMWIGFLIHNFLDVTFPSLGLEIGILLGASLAGSDAVQERIKGTEREAATGW